MTFQQILQNIRMLAASKGFYNRLYHEIIKLNEHETKKLKEELESKKFTDVVDMVLYFET